jgi:mono/diheme cytochrome c family protein
MGADLAHPVRRNLRSAPVTEIPEHLLKRSRERRAALGLGGGDAGGGDAPPEAPSGGGESAEPSPVPARAAAAPAEATATSSAPPVAAPPPPPPPYVQAALERPRIPRWALPVLGILPLWALIYAGTLVAHEPGITDPVLQTGQTVYNAQCAACHGATGAGGTGRQLNGGNVLLTFSDPQQHIEWVTNGSPAAGTPYGDPARPGGQHISQSDGYGKMPAFGSALTPEEIVAVVRYEREIIGGEDSTTAALATGEGTAVEGDADTPTNEAQQEGGDVGGQGSGGESDDASPGGNGEPAQSDNESGSTGSAGGEGDTTSGTTPPDG